VTTAADQTSTEQPIFTIIGERVALGPLRRDLLPLYQRWMNDFEVVRTLGVPLRPMTRDAEEEWLDHALKAEHEVHYTIYERATGRPIGNTALASINETHRSANYGILIGEKDCWGKGYGTETTRLMLDYAFTILGLHNILLTVVAFNQRGIRAYTKAGFREFGRRREAFWLGGQAHDVIYMECLSSEFQSPFLRRLIENRP